MMKMSNIDTNGGTAIVVFLKYLKPGNVKSRLASSLGNEVALNFYRICAEKLSSDLMKIRRECRKCIFFSDAGDEAAVREWIGLRFDYVPQVKGDIGNRLKHAFEYLFKQGLDRVIILASDTPDISVDTIEEAVDALGNYDIVIGPSIDGGYYLIGMNQFYNGLFEGITWSTEKVMKETLSLIDKLHLSVYSLKELRDIDTKDDLVAWLYTATDSSNPVLEYVKSLKLS